MSRAPKEDIAERFSDRARAERYRDRFKHGRHLHTHERESVALRTILALLGRFHMVLDVGSGPGRFVRLFMKYADRLIQLDYSSHMLHVSRDDHAVRGEQGGYLQASAVGLPLADHSVDLVFCHRLLNHLDVGDRRRALEEMARVSKRYVVVSCLRPPAVVRLIRRFFSRRKPDAGHVGEGQLLAEAEAAGLGLCGRTHIRGFPVSGSFLTLVTSESEAPCDRLNPGGSAALAAAPGSGSNDPADPILAGVSAKR